MSPVAVCVARALYYVLPNLAPFNVERRSRARRAGAGVARCRLTLAYAVVYIAILLPARLRSSVGGISSDGGGPRAGGAMKPGNRALLATIALLFMVSVGIQAVRDRDLKPFEPRGGMLWLQPGPAVKRMALGYDTWPPTSIGFAPSSTTAGSGWVTSPGGPTICCIRCSIW